MASRAIGSVGRRGTARRSQAIDWLGNHPLRWTVVQEAFMKTYTIPELSPKGSAAQITRTSTTNGEDDPADFTKKLIPAGSVGFWL